MKITYVCYGHVDVSLSLVKHLSEFIEIKLIIIFAKNKKSESVINFDNIKVSTGFQSKSKIKEIIGQEIINYIDNRFPIDVFIYDNLKLKSFKNIKLSYKLSKQLKENDIIHFSGQDATLIHLMFFLFYKKKIFTIHDYVGHSSEKSNFGDKFNKYLVKNEKTIVQNINDYKDINLIYGDKNINIDYIPFGALYILKEFLLKQEINEIKSNILFFGRISRYKGLIYLINAMKIVKKKYQNVKLTIAGSGNFSFDISELKKDNTFNIINRYIPNSELSKLIQESTIVVCPYIDATQSGVVMTAFAFNKPVIASDVGGLSEVIEDGVTGKLVPPKDSEKLANAIIKLLESPQTIMEMTENIEHLCKQGELSWANIAKKMVKIYKNKL